MNKNVMAGLIYYFTLTAPRLTYYFETALRKKIRSARFIEHTIDWQEEESKEYIKHLNGTIKCAIFFSFSNKNNRLRAKDV